MADSEPNRKKNRLLRVLTLPWRTVIERVWNRIRPYSPWRFLRNRRLLLAKHKGNKLTVRIPMTGCMMELDPNHLITLAWYVRADYEPNLIAGLRRFLRPGMVCMDIGANAGLFSLFMAKRVGNGGKVYAFEPTPDTFQRLRKNIDLNAAQHNIVAENVAVTERSGEVELHVGPPELCVFNSIGEVVHPSAKAGRFTRVLVPATTIDDYCAAHKINHVDCVKIDVEGAELQVLKGMGRVLKENPRIVLLVEFGQAMSVACGASVEIMAKWFEDFGFQLFMITSNVRLQPLKGVIPQNSEMVWAVRVVSALQT